MSSGSYLSLHLDRIPNKEAIVIKSMLSLLNPRMKYQWQISSLKEDCFASLSYSENKKIFTFCNRHSGLNLVVSYPLRAIKLMEALDELGQNNQSSHSKIEKVINKNKNLSFIENLYLQINQQRPFNIFYLDELHMTLFPRDGLCYLYNHLANLEGLDIKSFSILPLLDITVLDEDKSVETMDRVLWQFATIDGGTSLLDKISIDEPLQLENWPDFGMISCKSQALKITAMIVQKPLSISDMKELIVDDFKFQDLLILISTLYLMGLLIINQAEAQQENKINRTKNLLMHRIRTRLGI